MKKIVVVCGPTATGKSDFAVALSKRIEGEVISADSRQVYRGLNIGSGKITVEEMQGVPHHLLDVVDPKETFSVSDYKKYAVEKINEIYARNHTPIICGGTGFYIDAVICDTVFPAVPPNNSLRKELEKETLKALQEKLQLLDPRRYALIDTKNKVRLIRAIEIATTLGSVPTLSKTPQYYIEWHYLDFPDDVLKERIHTRLLKRFAQGMIEEVENLNNPPSAGSGGGEGLLWDRLESFGLEYRFIAQYLQKKLSYEEMVTLLERAIWHYAKRQRTWFKKYGASFSKHS